MVPNAEPAVGVVNTNLDSYFYPMKKILIPCLLLVACSNKKEEIVEQIKTEKNNLASLSNKSFDFTSRTRNLLRAANSTAEIDAIINSASYKAMKDSSFEVEIEIMAAKGKIDSLELELKKY